MDAHGEITLLLGQIADGDEDARSQLMERVHADLVRLAEIRMRKEFGHHRDNVTLEPGELVNETYLRLIKQRQRYDNRAHFFAIATRLMMRVLVDYQRQRLADKRFGGKVKVSLAGLEGGAPTVQPPTTDAEDLVKALDKLDALDRRAADVLKLKVLWGLRVEEIAETLGVSRSTIDREWRFARRWLSAELRPGSQP